MSTECVKARLRMQPPPESLQQGHEARMTTTGVQIEQCKAHLEVSLNDVHPQARCISGIMKVTAHNRPFKFTIDEWWA